MTVGQMQPCTQGSNTGCAVQTLQVIDGLLAWFPGGLSNFIPLPPAGKGEHGVRVCCFPARQLSSVVDIEISTDSFTEWCAMLWVPRRCVSRGISSAPGKA